MLRATAAAVRLTVIGVLTFAAPALASAASPSAAAAPAAAAGTFMPRVGAARGIVPPLGSGEIAAGPVTPVVYHGGAVMHDVTLHTIFWAPPGYRFDGSPGGGTLGYEPLIAQFLTDLAHDSATTANVFSTLAQYRDGRGPGSYQISYDPAVDSMPRSDPSPPRPLQCASPSGVAACITDLELQHEIDTVIGPRDPSARGLSNIWFVLLPPDVDTCSEPGACATNAYAGYHSTFDLGHGLTVYVAVPDPLVELTPPPGSDPQGNPEAEASIQTIAHETEEAITDPVGNGWMDPNGYEVADKCESGPEQGTPLGYGADGSPFNQVIAGHQYLLQDMWSNAASGCVQSSSATTSPPPLPTIDLRQYSSTVRGRVGAARRVPVAVRLFRAGTMVAVASTRTRGDGSWGPVTLRSARGAPHAVGDDRDQIAVSYGSERASPPPDVIVTGDGGNPFTESGFTGWSDLDDGYAVGARSVTIGPCIQTGVLALRVGATATEPPSDGCSTETDATLVSTRGIGAGTAVTLSSQDNRAESPPALDGALVKLTIGLGEPGSVSPADNGRLAFVPSGFPACTALLSSRQVRCSGLVPRARYVLTVARAGQAPARLPLARARARAGGGGVIDVRGPRFAGGDVLTLTNRAGRRLTALHVAHLQVQIDGDQTRIAAGRCQPGDYYGAPLSGPPTSPRVGVPGAGGRGTICPLNGSAAGLSTTDIAQTDEFSAGQTVTRVPSIESTAPLADETLYGSFIASAQTGAASAQTGAASAQTGAASALTGAPGGGGSPAPAGVSVSLAITAAASGRRVFVAPNVDTGLGVAVAALAPGPYRARWVLRDANGDTRTVTTRFFEAG